MCVHTLVSLSNYPSPSTSTVTSFDQFKGLKEQNLKYLVVLVFVGDLERFHGPDHGLHGCEDVLVNQFDETPLVLVGVARTVNNPHLFDECTLSTFTSA